MPSLGSLRRWLHIASLHSLDGLAPKEIFEHAFGDGDAVQADSFAIGHVRTCHTRKRLLGENDGTRDENFPSIVKWPRRVVVRGSIDHVAEHQPTEHFGPWLPSSKRC
jgi:hypothetical protein